MATLENYQTFRIRVIHILTIIIRSALRISQINIGRKKKKSIKKMIIVITATMIMMMIIMISMMRMMKMKMTWVKMMNINNINLNQRLASSRSSIYLMIFKVLHFSKKLTILYFCN